MQYQERNKVVDLNCNVMLRMETEFMMPSISIYNGRKEIEEEFLNPLFEHYRKLVLVNEIKAELKIIYSGKENP